MAGLDGLPTAVTTQTTTANQTTASSVGREDAAASLAARAQQQAVANLMKTGQAIPILTTPRSVPTITALMSAAAAGQAGSNYQQVLTLIHINYRFFSTIIRLKL